MAGSLEGKVAFITGAARGQGRAHAVRLAREGADIIAVDICAQIETANYDLATEADLAETARLVAELGRRAVTRVADVRERTPLTVAVAEAAAELGGIDIVVANAGISLVGPEVPMMGWFDTVSTNLSGVINTLEAAFPHLRENASLICISSMAAMMEGMVDNPAAGPGGAAYAHSKRAASRLVHDLALQLAPRSIRVNAVLPGNIDTPMIRNEALYRLFRPDLENPTWEDAQPGFQAMHKLPVPTLQPEDISEAVLFLASDSSRYVTGLQLKVDAGTLERARRVDARHDRA
ncbi:SDR family mycofactocin-dependent oxidoreductase [Actinocorallia herbida]|uniref:SDR family mycofactocin-dependent oxidoreductase n=1 Tax=Actinocorallia herbida TaxID=58109 RepID=A0A3N1D2N2_9ACTN|nr:mycofactocin-coupled SDR family oxidoreductase [Actinocorallia herbida]ROO87781.1 SDR family mycofactocin-dependent oxidoreductase [Actinocorallia herbida]